MKYPHKYAQNNNLLIFLLSHSIYFYNLYFSRIKFHRIYRNPAGQDSASLRNSEAEGKSEI